MSSRTVIAVGAALVAAAAVAGPAHSNGVVAVTINAANGTHTASIPDATVVAEADIANQLMTFLPDPSVPKATGKQSGMSLGRVAQLAGLDPHSALLQQVTVGTDDPGASTTDTLGGDEVGNGFFGDPTGGPKYALIQSRGFDGFDYIRPMRTSTDRNGDHEIYTGVGGNIDVAFTYDGELLDVGAPAASAVRVKIGTPVTFATPAVTLDGAPDGDNPAFAWDFGDGSAPAHGATASHAFATAGTWFARVTVTDDGGAVGVSPPVAIRVDPPDATTTTTTTTTTAGSPAAPGSGAGGPTGSGASSPTGTPSGPLVVVRTPTGTLSTPKAKARTHRHTPHHTGGSTASTPAATSGAAGTGAGSDDSGGSISPVPGVAGAPSAAASPTPVSAATPPAGLVGLLVDSAGRPLPPAGPAATHAAARAGGSDEGSGGWAAWAGGSAALILVVALGGLLAFEPRAAYRSLGAR